MEMERENRDRTQRGDLLRGFESRGWLRARRSPARAHCTKRRGQQIQPHGDRRGHHQPKIKADLPTHISVDAQGSGLLKDSIVLLEQVRTLDKHRLREKMGRLDPDSMNRVDQALSISFGLRPT